MELAQSLLLNEDAYKKVAEAKRPVFIYEWLRFLDKVLVAAQKVNFLINKLQSVNWNFIFFISVGYKGKSEKAYFSINWANSGTSGPSDKAIAGQMSCDII